jgi:lysozyme family protein
MEKLNSFNFAVALVLEHEGGYVNDPDDPGGETNYGISKRAYPKLDIARLSRGEAIRIYHRDYWRRTRCQKLPDQVAIAVFDTAVNMGCKRAVKILQKCVGASVDGLIGPQTLRGIRQVNGEQLLVDYMARRALHYNNIVIKKPTQEKYLRGWLRRLFSLHQTIIMEFDNE